MSRTRPQHLRVGRWRPNQVFLPPPSPKANNNNILIRVGKLLVHPSESKPHDREGGVQGIKVTSFETYAAEYLQVQLVCVVIYACMYTDSIFMNNS